MKDITITKKDREELLRHINIMYRSLTNVGELFDLELSDLRNLQELQWSNQFILREEKKDEK